ncbi:MAG TPA: hypothetical protein GXX40_10280 [Firmicutes bacterium]|nr:hypothetical protein [Bacillota bacterium]
MAWAIIVGIGVVLAISLSASTILDSDRGSQRDAWIPRIAVLSADAQLVKRVSYTRCGHTLTATEKAGPELAGRSLEALTSAYSGWSVKHFGEGAVELEKVVDGFCPEDSTYRLIKLSGDYVTVYWGRRPERVKAVLEHIPTALLSQLDKAQLEEGIVALGDEEVARLLEGLAE